MRNFDEVKAEYEALCRSLNVEIVHTLTIEEMEREIALMGYELFRVEIYEEDQLFYEDMVDSRIAF
jgi:hypothetical protein